jgi:copper chaperone CopZ
MPYKEIVKELKKLDPDMNVEITLDPGPKGYVEVCTVRAEYEGYGVSFDASFNYRTATLETNEMTVEEVIKLLKKKKLDKMTDRDFPGITNVCSTDSNSPEYEDVEWDEGTPEEIQEEADLFDLYFSGDIDCDSTFNGVSSFDIYVDGEYYTVKDEEE